MRRANWISHALLVSAAVLGVSYLRRGRARSGRHLRSVCWLSDTPASGRRRSAPLKGLPPIFITDPHAALRSGSTSKMRLSIRAQLAREGVDQI